MTIECGYLLRVQSEGKPDAFKGEIELQQISGIFFLVPHAAVRNPGKSPTHSFKVKNRAGDYVHFGNAWQKEFKSGQKGYFFSITIDGPGMPHSITVNAWPDDEQPKETPKEYPANFTVRWQRPKPQGATVIGGGSEAPASGVDQDEIPY